MVQQSPGTNPHEPTTIELGHKELASITEKCLLTKA